MNISRALTRQLIDVKTLKIIFRTFFWILSNREIIIVNCKTLSVMTLPFSILLRPNGIWLAVLLSNFYLYDFNNTRFLKFLKIVSDLLFTFEILSHYLNIDNSYWVKKDVLWITDKVFREKPMVKMVSTFSSCISLLNFWCWTVFVIFFIVIRLFVKTYWSTMHNKHPFTSIVFYWLWSKTN